MKIGISTNSFAVKSYGRWGDETYKKLREHGFECIDFDMSNTESGLYILSEEELAEKIEHEKNLLKEAGITVNQVHGPWRFPARDFKDEDREERIESMKKSIRMTAALGCKNWVVHPFMPYGVCEAGHKLGGYTWNVNCKLIAELLPTARECDVTICLENMPFLRYSLSKPEMILKLVEHINDEYLKICLDTGHVAAFRELNLADEVRRLGKWIKVLHVHDTMPKKDLHLMPTLGVINWGEFAGALREIGYDGVFSLETNPPQKLCDREFEIVSKKLFKVTKEIDR